MNNLQKRTVFGLVFIIVMLAGLLVNKYLFACLICFMMAGMMYEFLHVATAGRKKEAVVTTIAVSIAQFLLVFSVFAFGLDQGLLALSLIPSFIIIFISVLSKQTGDPQDYAYMLASMIYIAIPLVLYNLLAFHDGEFNGKPVLAFFIMIWCSDVGAYCAGSFLGARLHSKKMSPNISPNKTWVGFWGGLLLCMIAGLVLVETGFITDLSVLQTLILALIVHIGGVCGDLFESLWKRYFGIKDSGNIIPGHGGLLDRFDSSLVAIPLGTIYLLSFNLI